MFESKYSKVLTVILVIVIIAIIGLLGFLAFDYIQKYYITKQASDFVEEYQGDITTGNESITEGQTIENVTVEGLDETPTTTVTTTTKKHLKDIQQLVQ